MTGTLFAAAGQTASDPQQHAQWRLARLQVVNWGPFDGHHSLDIPTSGMCLLTGGSGTGKSSLLDAVTATLMPATAALNAASQESASGDREDDRTVLSYTRGQYEKTRDDSGALVRMHLRGNNHRPVWSAVAMTWHNAATGRVFTAGRTWLVPPDARTLDQTRRALFTTDGPFDLAGLEPAAAAGLTGSAIRAACPRLTLHATYAAFRAELGTDLQIGQAGNTEQALRLLAKIQQGRPFSSVDQLFQQLVLDEPASLARGREAVLHFADLRDSYQAMVDARDKIAMLDPIRGLRDSLQEAIDTQAAVRGLRYEDGPDGATTFGWWVAGLRHTTARAAADRAADTAKAAAAAAAEARTAADTAGSEAEALADAIRAAGGDRLEVLQRQAEAAAEHARKTADNLPGIAAQLAPLGDLPATAEVWHAMRAAAEQFRADLPAGRRTNQEKQDGLKDQQYPLREKRREARAERASLEGRASRIPRQLHEQRAELADRLGWAADDLPFVAELLDVDDQYREWRKAVELALGGFATTLLVDDRDLPALRRAVNDLSWQRRIPFAGAQLDRQPPGPAGPATLPGRVVTKPGSPFAGWLAERIADRYDYTCVDSPTDLGTVRRGLTVTGQTSDGRRGAHGGNDTPSILGFTNTDRMAELDTEIKTLDQQLRQLEQQQRELQDEAERWNERAEAAAAANRVAWDDIDLAGARERADRLNRDVEEFTRGNDQLQALRGALGDAKAREQEHRKTQGAKEDAAKTAADQATRMTDAAAAAGERRAELTAQGLAATEAQAQLLGEVISSPPDTMSNLDRMLVDARTKLQLAPGRAASQEKQIRQHLNGVFARYQERFGDHGELGTDPVDDYDGYAGILSREQDEGLPVAADLFLERVGRWSTQDLLHVLSALNEAERALRARLEDVNSVLATLPFGPRRERLEITGINNRTGEQLEFVKDLRQLASLRTDAMTQDEAADRYQRVAALVGRLADGGFASRMLDVRRHVILEARQYDRDGSLVGVTTTTKAKSGGEAQETMAFVLAAALRFALSGADEQAPPPYALVVLDEGYIKADTEFTTRAIAAWGGVGFQVLIAAPPEKTGSLEPHAQRIWQVVKGSDRRARAIDIDAAD